MLTHIKQCLLKSTNGGANPPLNTAPKRWGTRCTVSLSRHGDTEHGDHGVRHPLSPVYIRPRTMAVHRTVQQAWMVQYRSQHEKHQPQNQTGSRRQQHPHRRPCHHQRTGQQSGRNGCHGHACCLEAKASRQHSPGIHRTSCGQAAGKPSYCLGQRVSRQLGSSGAQCHDQP